MTTDLALLRRYHEHADAFAFRELVQAHAGMVFATARRITRDAALAEDVAQETFLELARHAPSVRESVGAWLHRVAWRRACNTIRDASTRRRHEAAAAPDETTQETREATWEELEPLIDAALDDLPEKLRGPLVEHFLAGRTQQEIAARLAVSQSTVSRLLDAGVDRLRAHLQRQGVAVGGTLAVLVAAHAVTPAPAALVTSLGKLAVSGLGGNAATAVARHTGATAWQHLLLRSWRPIAFGIATFALAAWLLLRAPAKPDSPPPSSVVTSTSTSTSQSTPPAEVHDWHGRAFCPMCAPPIIAGRRPEHGIFIRAENGRDVIYDLALSEPLSQFHQRLCVPSMDDAQAVHVRGTLRTREGRPTLVASILEPKGR